MWIYQHGLVYAFPTAASPRSCCGNQLPTVFETQIINLLPVYSASRNTKQFKYVNSEAAKLSPHPTIEKSVQKSTNFLCPGGLFVLSRILSEYVP